MAGSGDLACREGRFPIGAVFPAAPGRHLAEKSGAATETRDGGLPRTPRAQAHRVRSPGCPLHLPRMPQAHRGGDEEEDGEGRQHEGGGVRPEEGRCKPQPPEIAGEQGEDEGELHAPAPEVAGRSLTHRG